MSSKDDDGGDDDNDEDNRPQVQSKHRHTSFQTHVHFEASWRHTNVYISNVNAR